MLLRARGAGDGLGWLVARRPVGLHTKGLLSGRPNVGAGAPLRRGGLFS